MLDFYNNKIATPAANAPGLIHVWTLLTPLPELVAAGEVLDGIIVPLEELSVDVAMAFSATFLMVNSID